MLNTYLRPGSVFPASLAPSGPLFPAPARLRPPSKAFPVSNLFPTMFWLQNLQSCGNSPGTTQDRIIVRFSTGNPTPIPPLFFVKKNIVPCRFVCAFWKCVWCLCARSIIVAIFHWLFSKDCAARRRESMCLSKSGQCEVWGLRPARPTVGSVWLMQKLGNEHVTLSATRCHRTSTHTSTLRRNFCITFDLQYGDSKACF